MIKSIINKVIAVGIFPDTNILERKRIKLTNGILVLVGGYALFLGMFMAVMEYAIYRSMTQAVVIGLLIHCFGIVSLLFIRLNRRRWYFTVRYSILIFLCLVIFGLSLLYGKVVRIDLYFILTLLLPFGLFSKNKQIIPMVVLSGFLFLLINVMYQYFDPILESDQLQDKIWYFINVFMLLVATVSIVSFFKKQNEINEDALSVEVELHKKTTQQLEKSNEAKDRFFSVVSHDLKGPIGNISQLFNTFAYNEIPERLYNHMRDSAINTHSMLEDLLMWARSQKRHVEIRPINFDLKVLLYKMVKFFEIQANNKNIELNVVTSNESFYGFADLTTTTIVIRNLISNSIKFTPSGGKIILSLKEEADSVKISVSDTGIGIPKDKLDGLFKIGSNVSTQGTNKEKGTGMGLILCKEFVESNGGRIWANSEKGGGSVFSFTVPQGIEVDVEEMVSRIRTKKIRALVVEDSYLDMETTTNSLKEVGVRFDISEAGDDSIEKALNKDYDIIFMDIDLPVHDGIYINKKIRKNKHNAYIVALSSYSRQEVEEKDSNVKFDGFLRKPMVKEDLVLCLSSRFL